MCVAGRPDLSEWANLSVVIGLQNLRLLVGEEVTGIWAYTTAPPEDIEEPEYSEEFPEKIIASDCGGTAIDADTLIPELDEVLRRAREQDDRKR